MLPTRFRRSMVIFVPILTISVLLGFTDGFAKINENLFSTGINLGIIVAILNLFLLWLIYKKQVP